MSNLVFNHAPNRITQVIAAVDTGWHQLTLPAGLTQPISGRVNTTVAMTCLSNTNVAGGTVFVDFDDLSTPTVGFPILSGQTLVFGVNTRIWYKFATATDSLYLIYAF